MGPQHDVRISGDGTDVSWGSKFFFLSFCILNSNNDIFTSQGIVYLIIIANHLLAVVKTTECCNNLSDSLQPEAAEINRLAGSNSLTIFKGGPDEKCYT